MAIAETTSIERTSIGNNKIRISLDTAHQKSASYLVISSHVFRIGAAEVTTGGLGDVETLIPYQRKGYARQIMNNAIEFMKEQEYDISLLFGIENFYSKFGYATILNDWNRVLLKTQDIQHAKPTLKASLKLRSIQKTDIESILAIYNKANATRSCTKLRTPEELLQRYQYAMETTDATAGIMVIEENNTLIGYIQYAIGKGRTNYCPELQSLILEELGMLSPSAMPHVLTFLGDFASKHGVQQIECAIPMDSWFAIYCRQFTCRVILNYPKDAEAMGQIINQDSFFSKMTKELERRQKLVGFQPMKEYAIRFSTELGSTDLLVNPTGTISCQKTDDSHVYEVNLSQTHLIQLFMGVTCIEVLSVDVIIPKDIFFILKTWFPRAVAEVPHVWVKDKF